jgi:hypothetical protein
MTEATGAGDTGAAAAAAAAASAAAGGTGAAAASAWHGQTEPEAIAYIGNKGWQNAGDMLKSYQGAEKLIGRDPSTLLQMPRSDDPEGFRSVMSKLGMPETADKYTLDAPTDVQLNPAYVDWAKATFHKVGLTAEQGKQLSAANNEFMRQALAQEEQNYNVSVTADKNALLAEWGGGAERMFNVAKLGASALGFNVETINAIEKSIGYAATMKLFANIGQKLGEDKFVGDTGGTRGFSETMTQPEAKQAWEQWKGKPENVKALFDPSHPGHKAAKEMQTKLFAIAFAEG